MKKLLGIGALLFLAAGALCFPLAFWQDYAEGNGSSAKQVANRTELVHSRILEDLRSCRAKAVIVMAGVGGEKYCLVNWRDGDAISLTCEVAEGAVWNQHINGIVDVTRDVANPEEYGPDFGKYQLYLRRFVNQ